MTSVQSSSNVIAIPITATREHSYVVLRESGYARIVNMNSPSHYRQEYIPKIETVDSYIYSHSSQYKVPFHWSKLPFMSFILSCGIPVTTIIWLRGHVGVWRETCLFSPVNLCFHTRAHIFRPIQRGRPCVCRAYAHKRPFAHNSAKMHYTSMQGMTKKNLPFLCLITIHG